MARRAEPGRYGWRGLRMRTAVGAAALAAVFGTGALLWVRRLNNTHVFFDVNRLITRWGIPIGVPTAALLIGTVVWFTVARALRPVEAVRRELADITSGSLDRRVPVPNSGDELTALAVTTNATLDRLEQAAERQRRFIADAAHELRSPIASLRTVLEVPLAHPEIADWPHTVADALADVERLQHLADDLLLLARLDADPAPPADPVDVAEIIRRLTLEAHRSPGPRIRTEIGPAWTAGSARQIERMVRNLLDNARHHAAGSVEVTVTDRAGRLVVEIADDGPGIPPEHRESVFERFTRLDGARSRDDGGAGLGLAIARNIAERHHGTLSVAPSARGAVLEVTLPSVPAGPPPA